MKAVVVNDYVCSATIVFTLRGSGRRWTAGGPRFQDNDVFHACSGSSVTILMINKFFF